MVLLLLPRPFRASSFFIYIYIYIDIYIFPDKTEMLPKKGGGDPLKEKQWFFFDWSL